MITGTEMLPGAQSDSQLDVAYCLCRLQRGHRCLKALALTDCFTSYLIFYVLLLSSFNKIITLLTHEYIAQATSLHFLGKCLYNIPLIIILNIEN